jgi:hypothetical protein
MATSHHPSKAVDLPPFAIAPLDSVEKPDRLFARKHHADVAGRNPRRPDGVKFAALGKRRDACEADLNYQFRSTPSFLVKPHFLHASERASNASLN